MRAINKNGEPRSLTEHRLTAHSDYDNYKKKDELRACLVAEQGGICCYCMGRIRPNKDEMKIEHWQCQDLHEDKQLVYGNMLGACLGGKGKPRSKQHCDTRKGNDDLQWNPADSNHMIESRLRYEFDGTIRANNEPFNTQLNEVLNLNIRVLKNNRKAVLDGIRAWWKREKRRLKGPVPKASLQRELDKRSGACVELEPFCQVAVWWLRVRLEKTQ